GIYTQSPKQPIKIQLNLYYNTSGTFVDVFLNAPADDKVLLLSSQPDAPQGKENNRAFKKLHYRAGPETYYSYYDQEIGGSPLPEDQRGYVIATFRVPRSTLTVKPEEVIARLPLVGQGEDATQYTPAAATINTDAEIYLNPALRARRKIS